VSCWLKRHEPAAFLCALLNAQPMGFYSPSALVQDARRHDVVVLPVDVNRSHRDHLLVAGAAHDRAAFADGSNRQPAVRLGLRLVRSLSAGGIAQVLTARETGGPFGTIAELVARTGTARSGRRWAPSACRACSPVRRPTSPTNPTRCRCPSPPKART